MREKALIIGVNTSNDENYDIQIDELVSLAEARDLEVLGKIIQNLHAPNKTYYVGSGKVDEINEFIENESIDIVIFDNELSPTQTRNLEKRVNCKIIDRTDLILEIFETRAKTKEAKLQVEIAHLKYLRPRLIGTGVDYDRQRGGSGNVNRGAGEKKHVLARKRIEKAISDMEQELKTIAKVRDTQRKRRTKANVPLVALVGYTNVGKSSLMNKLISLSETTDAKETFVKDMLFATLETTIRNVKLESKKPFLLSDTVGFVSNLPHDLVKAFHSTLEEVKYADLILHVIDISNPNYQQQVKVTTETLEQIGVQDIPQINVYNKVDKLPNHDLENDEDIAYISVNSGYGILNLIEKIDLKLHKGKTTVELLIPFEKGDIINYFKTSSEILNIEYQSDGTKITTKCTKSEILKYEKYLIK